MLLKDNPGLDPKEIEQLKSECKADGKKFVAGQNIAAADRHIHGTGPCVRRPEFYGEGNVGEAKRADVHVLVGPVETQGRPRGGGLGTG